MKKNFRTATRMARTDMLDINLDASFSVEKMVNKKSRSGLIGIFC